MKYAGQEDRAAHSAIVKARTDLRVQIKLVRPLQKHHMPALHDLLDAEEQTSENIAEDDKPEEDPLYLPSAFSSHDRDQFGLQKLAETEMKMRRCYAESELEQLKLAIRLYLVDVAGKRKDIQGIRAQTRAQAKLKKDIKRRDKCMRRYNLHFAALCGLGYDEEKDKTFQRITDDVLKAVKNVRSPEELGSGRQADAWFWREGKDISSVSKRTKREMENMNEEGEKESTLRGYCSL